MTTLVMDDAGNLSVPEEVRRELGLAAQTRFEIGRDESGLVVLREVDEADVTDPDVFERRLREAREDYDAGRTFQMTPEQFRQAVSGEDA